MPATLMPMMMIMPMVTIMPVVMIMPAVTIMPVVRIMPAVTIMPVVRIMPKRKRVAEKKLPQQYQDKATSPREKKVTRLLVLK